MRHWIRVCFFAALLCSYLISAQATERWVIDNHHSYVRWDINHLGFSTQTGKWYVDGFLWLDEKNPAQSRVEVSIDLARMVTGIPELDKHLQGPQFFDIAQFPKATWISKTVHVIDDHHAKVQGILTLHGISKPVDLDVTFNKAGKNPVYDRMTAGFTATAHLKRSDFGMNTLRPQLGDEVALEIGVEAYQPDEKK